MCPSCVPPYPCEADSPVEETGVDPMGTLIQLRAKGLYGCCLDVNGRVWLYEESAKARGISDEDAMLVYVQG